MRRIIQAILFIMLLVQAKSFAQQVQTGSGKPLLKSEDYISRFGDLSNLVYRIKTEKDCHVVFFGGSITYNPGWRQMVMQYLQQKFPDTRFTFLNAGIPSLGSLPHAFRISQDVLSRGRVDLMFLETAVNDRANGTNEQTQQRAMAGIISHVRKTNPYANIVVMAFVDPDKIVDYNAGKIPQEVQVHQQMAATWHLPFINLAKEVTDRINAAEFTWEGDFKNLHPSAFGQNIYFRSIRQLLSAELVKQAPEKLKTEFRARHIDRYAYTNGDYLSISNAKSLNNFTLYQSWKPTDHLIGTRPGFVNVPVLVGEQPGASFELSFTGSVIGLGIVSGPDAGMIEYSIDGKIYPALDLFTQWSKSLHLPWYLLLDDELSKGKHVLKLTISNKKNGDADGTACRIVYFLVNK